MDAIKELLSGYLGGSSELVYVVVGMVGLLIFFLRGKISTWKQIRRVKKQAEVDKADIRRTNQIKLEHENELRESKQAIKDGTYFERRKRLRDNDT